MGAASEQHLILKKLKRPRAHCHDKAKDGVTRLVFDRELRVFLRLVVSVGHGNRSRHENDRNLHYQ